MRCVARPQVMMMGAARSARGSAGAPGMLRRWPKVARRKSPATT